MKLANRRMRKKVRGLKKQKTALLREVFSLQRFCNEVAARLQPQDGTVRPIAGRPSL